MDSPIVLLVDDEPNILKTLRRLFLDDDYDIHTAGNGSEGLALIKGGLSPAVIISDQRMPEMGGAEFLAKAKVLVPESIRMVLTGYADINAAVAAINQGGIYRYILKPWNDDELRQTVREALRYYQLKAENIALNEELEVKNQRLSEVNEQLEEMVKARTAELHQKVLELEGRDKIQQYLLHVHPLGELIDIVLSVVAEVCGMDAVSYFAVSDAGEIKNVASFGEDVEGSLTKCNIPAQIRSRLSLLKGDGDDQKGEVQIVKEGGNEYGFAPVATRGKLFGVLVVSRSSDRPIDEADMSVVVGFALQAAIGINDCQVQDQFGDIQASLDDVLSDFAELDTMSQP